MEHERPLRSVPDDELLRRLAELIRRSRSVEHDLLAHIAEVDARKLYAREACSSMFVYCARVLGLTGAEAYMRITAARASRKHPVLLTMLEDGRLNVTTISLLAPHLTVQNRDDVLARAAHRSKRQVLELIAEIAPRPDAPTVIRRLPERRLVARAELSSLVPTPDPQLAPGAVGGGSNAPTGELRPAADSAASVPAAQELCPDRVEPVATAPASIPTIELRPDRVASLAPTATDAGSTVPTVAEPAAPPMCTLELRPDVAKPPAVVLPLSPGRYKVQFTASAGLRDKLERLQTLMRSTVPDGDLAALIEIVVTEKIERVEARRFGRTKAPRKTLATTDLSRRSRYVPVAVKRAVSERDGDQCCFRDRRGRRCAERARLEFHHRYPYGLGGGPEPRNISLRCPHAQRLPRRAGLRKGGDGPAPAAREE
jgi:hypothetical protein